MKKKEESYTLSLKGLIWGALKRTTTDDMGYTADDVVEAIELYLRRHGNNAIILDGQQFIFAKVENTDEANKKTTSRVKKTGR